MVSPASRATTDSAPSTTSSGFPIERAPDRVLARSTGAVYVAPAPLAFNEAAQVLFTHLPKTGGSTLRGVFAPICAYKGWTFEQIIGSPNLSDTGSVHNYRAIPADRLRRAQCIWGHLPRGLHDLSARHLTLLRDPFARAISTYAFSVSRRQMNMGTSPAALYRGDIMMDNLQTRMLSGRLELMSTDTPCTQKDLDLALENLTKRYALAGDLARFNDFLAVLLAMLDAPGMIYFQKNITPVKLPPELSEEIRAEVAIRDHFDIALLEAVKNKVRHMPGAAVQRSSSQCLAFDNLSGSKAVLYQDGPDTHIAYLESVGIPVRRHVFDPMVVAPWSADGSS